MTSRWLLGLFGLLLSCQQSVPPLIPKPVALKDELEAEGDEIFDPKIDILFVIDDSGSMGVHQRNLANNVDLFIRGFLQRQDIDYHIGVITTSNSPFFDPRRRCCGKLVDLGGATFVTRNTPNGQYILRTNMIVGSNGDSEEMIFDPIAASIFNPENAAHNRGFYRDDAFLAIVIISDAEDQSRQESSTSLAQKLTQFKGLKDRWTAFGVIVPTQDPFRCERDEFGKTPTRIEHFLSLAKLDPGMVNVYNLCDPAFGQNLAKIGDLLTQVVGNVIYLKRIPIVSSIRVRYGSQVIEPDPVKGWSYDPARNAIILGPGIVWTQQPPGTRIRVRYESYRDPLISRDSDSTQALPSGTQP